MQLHIHSQTAKVYTYIMQIDKLFHTTRKNGCNYLSRQGYKLV